MYYRKASKKRKRRLLAIRVIVVGLLLFLLLFLIDRQIRPIICSNAKIQAKVLAAQALNNAVLDALKDVDAAYNRLVTLDKGEENKVTSIQTNTAAISKIQTSLTDAVMRNLAKITQSDFRIRLGTLLNPVYLSGRGPSLNFHLEPSGTVTTKILSSFTDAGINQTHHEITFQIAVPLSASIPGYHAPVTVETSFLLADTVIVGDIPQYYTRVITEDQHVVDDLNDYSPNMQDNPAG